MAVVNGRGEVVGVQELELEWVHVVQEDAVQVAVLRLAFLGPGVEWLNGSSHMFFPPVQNTPHLLLRHSYVVVDAASSHLSTCMHMQIIQVTKTFILK